MAHGSHWRQFDRVGTWVVYQTTSKSEARVPVGRRGTTLRCRGAVIKLKSSARFDIKRNQQKARSSNICTRFIVKGTISLELEGGGGRGDSPLWLTENVTYAGELREYSITNSESLNSWQPWKEHNFSIIMKKVYSRKFMSRCCRDDKFNKATVLDFSDNDMKNQDNQEHYC